MGDHTETVQIDYDPLRVTYGELLDVFWKGHSPISHSYTRQYMSAIFYHGEEQRRVAHESRKREEAKRGRKLYTEILPAPEFHLAEDYHQKFRLSRVPELMEEFRAMYPDFRGVVDSTAAARVNGYVSGYGTLSGLEAEIEGLGLSEEGKRRLIEIVSKREGRKGFSPFGLIFSR
jgi:peptide methionine sulfoxide reductase MsrA